MTRLFIVRHGNTFEPGETPRRIGARTDLPLTAGGVMQAKALGKYFVTNGIEFQTAITSSLTRTRQTASTILAEQPTAPTLTNAHWLVEIEHGPDEGLIEKQVIARIGAAVAEWERGGPAPPGWIVNAPIRLAAWQAFMATPPPGDTLLVTSNGAARFAVLAIGAALPQPVKLGTGAFGVIELTSSSDGSARSAAWKITAWDKRP